MAFATQRVLPTSPIYRGPNPTHIEVQICSPWKGSKALHTSQGTWAFALNRNPGPKQLDTLAIRTSSLQQLDTLAIRTRLSGSDARKSSNWTLQLYPHKEFPSNWTLQLSAQEPRSTKQLDNSPSQREPCQAQDTILKQYQLG